MSSPAAGGENPTADLTKALPPTAAADGPPIAVSSISDVRTLRAFVATYWHLLAVLSAFCLTLFFIPVFADVPSTDDWVYARSVEILLHDSRLRILDLSVVTLVFQVIWGAYFALILGPIVDSTFGALRFSTIVLTGLSIPALYGICRELGVARGKAALGAAVYAFNPLTYALAFTFMSDPQFSALMVISTYFTVRGLRRNNPDARSILWGSVFASLAFLIRQQGLLLPLATGIYLLAARRWWFNRVGLHLAWRVAGMPALTLIAYVVWLVTIHGVPEQQGEFVDQVRDAGFSDTRLLVGRLIFISMAYIGLFVLPITLSAFVSLKQWRLPRARPGIAFLVVWLGIVIYGALVFNHEGRVMPYIQQFLGLYGVGPTDIIGGRPVAISPRWSKPLTVVCLGSVAVFGLLVSRRIGMKPSAQRSSVALVTVMGLFQVAGVLPPSYHFRDWIISVDRYLLPLIPFSICLAIWAIRDVSINTVRAWSLAGLFAVFSMVATRDFIVFEQENWRLAERAVDQGVPLTKLDAGASWDGYHLYEDALAKGITQTTPYGPWWTYLFGLSTDSTYLISTGPVRGYVIVGDKEYSSWLVAEPTKLYILRRETIPGPR